MIYRFGTKEYDLSIRTYVMGILNVTPDSFSDGGKYWNVQQAISHAMTMVEDGADFIDIGGESTRPGAEEISLDEELRRVIPVLREVTKLCSIPISIDTWKSEVARQSLDAGAVIVNDVTGLHGDSHMADIIQQYNAHVIIMHMQGRPRTMQADPQYDDIMEEICFFFNRSISLLNDESKTRILLDPGIGFGKTVEHNLHILKNLQTLKRFGYPLLLGTSRKSFIGKILDLPVHERLEGTAATVAISVMNGANIVRVHDIKAMKRVTMIADAVKRQP